ncbi:bidirectional hydrogenase complex protein HoxE [Candidatus Oscillochloris fontis]|uniref:bidirectional hydrogenase complex protein HoxE n=1 Tax=Candidatus Oscillochloris fontis TaxID=2496868 RepID=UPI00101DCA29|nr:bidirectional hydrogenase complex protein HoxE [Candidatus Oscillochloris fontis]
MATPHPTRDAAAAAGDTRLKILEATMKRNQYRPDALIEVLHKAQEIYGFLSPDLLVRIARSLHLPPSRVYGVATFYHFFSLVPQGAHTCTICLGTACYVRGASELIARAEDVAGIAAGHTTPDGKLSLASVRCIGACGIAPAVVIDGNVTGHMTSDDVAAQVAALLSAPELLGS